MKLISDYDPNQTKLLPEQWYAIKDQHPGVPFEISDDKVAGRLKFIEIIKSERVDIPKEKGESIAILSKLRLSTEESDHSCVISLKGTKA